MAIDKTMFADFLHEHPFQPATALWRAVEVAEVARRSLPQGRGLDLGCGDGKLTNILLARTGLRDLVGVDLDPNETQEAKSYQFYSAIHTAPAHEIPEPASSFDFVFSNSVLEHIDPVEPVLHEVARILKPGGRFIFTVPTSSFHACLRGPLIPGANTEKYLDDLDERCAHRNYFGAERWREVLAKHGLRLEVAAEYLNKQEVRRWETISRFTAGILYGAFNKRKHPIEIQRSLKLRGNGITLPKILAVPLATLLSFGVTNRETVVNGCLYIEGFREPLGQ